MNCKEISGANSQSLDSARKNYSLFQACDKAYINNVRKPLFNEFPENNL